MIRAANFADIPEILKLTLACGKDLSSRGIDQWNEHYPNRKVFENDVLRNELYVMEKKSLLGCIVLTELKDAEYGTVQWVTGESRHLYVHRLAVHPAAQGRGIGRHLMDFAEQWGRKEGYSSIRLDTFSLNPRSNALYRNRGYLACGTIQLPAQSDIPFNCYELPL